MLDQKEKDILALCKAVLDVPEWLCNGFCINRVTVCV
jgi:hypothetical protein